MHSDKFRVKGNVTLTTVIIAGAILITAGLTVLVNAVDITFSSKSYQERVLSEIALTACFEEGMSHISRLSTYTGTVSIILPDNRTCDIVITNDISNPTLKNLSITATSADFLVTRTKKVDVSTSPFTLIN